MPVIITYDVSNLSNNTQEFRLSNSLTYGKSNIHLSVEHPIVLEPCTVYKTFEASFTPRDSGNYFFEINDSRIGSTGIGFTIPNSDTDTIESFDGKIFFVSSGYDAGIGTNDTILFHGIKFTPPAYPDSPTPGGSISTTITFKDGIIKHVGFLGPGAMPSLESDNSIEDKLTPTLVENNNVYAGILHDYDGIHLLVSVDAVNLSPLKQLKLGVKFHNVECKEGLKLAYKKADDTSACVKTTSMIELVIRGWAEDTRILLGCLGDRVEKCYPNDIQEYRKALYEYYFGRDDNLTYNFTKTQTINACTEHQICLGEFDNGTKIRVACDYPIHDCGVVPFDRNNYNEDADNDMGTNDVVKQEPSHEPTSEYGNIDNYQYQQIQKQLESCKNQGLSDKLCDDEIRHRIVYPNNAQIQKPNFEVKIPEICLTLDLICPVDYAFAGIEKDGHIVVKYSHEWDDKYYEFVIENNSIKSVWYSGDHFER
jgi:hypothetical protein